MTGRCIALFHHGWADWEAGFVLACQSVPTTPTLVLDFDA